MDNRPVLVIMAAGMGSRYGGLKQIDPVDEYGNLIIDFSIYDAIEAGFERVIFIIKKEIEADFKEMIGNRISKYIEVEYVYQDLHALPDGFTLPSGRTKPWGTAHAVLSCESLVNSPFAVINADDYYGKSAFLAIYQELVVMSNLEAEHYVMVGYKLYNTLTEYGSVARGICTIERDGWLNDIKERTRIEKQGTTAQFTEDEGKTWTELAEDTIVSMNVWGFTESIFKEIRLRFSAFLQDQLESNPLKCEFFLPNVVGELLQENKCRVKVIESLDRWYGVTYREDKENVEDAIEQMKAKGWYPKKLWEER